MKTEAQAADLPGVESICGGELTGEGRLGMCLKWLAYWLTQQTV